MKIILKQDVKNLGYKDDVLEVKNGYANNFLIPQGMAIVANSGNIKMLEENLRQAKFKQDRIKQEAQQLATRMTDVQVKIGAKVGSNGKIFGAITPLQISQALKNQGYEIDRRRIVLDAEPKELGQFTATVNLHREVSVKVIIDVVAE